MKSCESVRINITFVRCESKVINKKNGYDFGLRLSARVSRANHSQIGPTKQSVNQPNNNHNNKSNSNSSCSVVAALAITNAIRIIIIVCTRK